MNAFGIISEKYKKMMRSDIDNIIYWWSILAVVCVAAMYSVCFLLIKVFSIRHMSCGFYSVFGIPCPGCGGTRALVSLLHGRVLTALRYNAFAVYCCVLYAVYFCINTAHRISGGKVRAMRFREWYMYIALIILILQYIIKVIRFTETGMI